MYFTSTAKSGLVRLFRFIIPFICVLFSGYSADAQKNENWQIICQKSKVGKVCIIQYQIMVRKKIEGKTQTVGRLISAVVQKVKKTKAGNTHVMNLLTPLGTNLRAGVKIAIDKGPEYSYSFARCTNQGCLVIIPVSKKLIDSMKRGKKLRIGFLPFGADKTMVVDLELTGFTKQLKKLK